MKFSASRKSAGKSGFGGSRTGPGQPFSKKLTKCRTSADGIFFDFQPRRNEKYKKR
jgi:hypothetical protein